MNHEEKNQFNHIGKKMKSDSYFISKANISSKWIKYSNMKVKLQTFQVISLTPILGEEFLNQAIRNVNHKGENDTLHWMKWRTAKDQRSKRENTSHKLQYICYIGNRQRILFQKVQNSFISIRRLLKIQLKNGQKYK